MIDITSINAVSGILAAIGVIVGIVFAVLQRQTDLIMRLNSAFGSKDILEEYKGVLSLESKDYKFEEIQTYRVRE